MDTEVIYAVGAVTVSILGALRFSKCTRIKCGCIEIDRDASTQAGPLVGGQPDAVAVAVPRDVAAQPVEIPRPQQASSGP